MAQAVWSRHRISSLAMLIVTIPKTEEVCPQSRDSDIFVVETGFSYVFMTASRKPNPDSTSAMMVVRRYAKENKPGLPDRKPGNQGPSVAGKRDQQYSRNQGQGKPDDLISFLPREIKYYKHCEDSA